MTMDTISKVRQHIASRTADAVDVVRRGLRKGVKTPADITKLTDAFIASDLSASDLAREGDIVAEFERLKSLADEAPKLVDERWAAEKARIDAIADYERVKDEAEGKVRQAVANMYAAIRRADEACTAVGRR